MSYSARIILDSVGPNGARLTTFELTFPRFLLAEFNTHRLFSRNSASSRAIPVEKRIAAVDQDPFIPEVFGANQKGMQSTQDLEEGKNLEARQVWTDALEDSVLYAKVLAMIGVHKQLANRILEPFCWQTVLFTATELDNFWALRDSGMAQPEFQKITRMAREAYESSTPQILASGQWHLPLVTGVDEQTLLQDYPSDILRYISAGRCARVSYLTHDGRRDPQADIDLAYRLLKEGHMSPFEHVAQALTRPQWEELAAEAALMWIELRIPMGNLFGWLQFRKTLTNEHNYGLFDRG